MLASRHGILTGHRMCRRSFLSSQSLALLLTARTSILYNSATTQIRGKKSKASVNHHDLPQGVIPLEPLPYEEPAPSYPTVVQQARSNMRRFHNCVLLTRVGGFYELYFEQADDFGPLLNLKVAQKKTNAGPVSMAGFPFFQLDRYLKILVKDLNRYVAIAEEFPNDNLGKVKSGGLIHDRRVSRIITPGTLIDENFMDPFSNNYVLAFHLENPIVNSVSDVTKTYNHDSTLKIGLAWLDLSTGHFFTQSTTLATLPSFLARIGPREIILDEGLQSFREHGIFAILADDHHLITYASSPTVKTVQEWTPMLESPVPTHSIVNFSPEEVIAGSCLLQYIETRLQGSNIKLQPPVQQLDLMGIDKNTMRALEIKKSMREDVVTGSLLHAVRRTVTKGGARQLDNWLSSPSTSMTVINSRLNLVTYLFGNNLLRERIVVLLKQSHDSHRLLQKFAFGRGDAEDLLALASTVDATQELLRTLTHDGKEDDSVIALVDRIKLDGPNILASRIKQAIDEDGIVLQHRIEEGESGQMQALAQAVVNSEGSQDDMKIFPKGVGRKKPMSIKEHYLDGDEAWIMKLGASPTLKRLHKSLAALANEKSALGEELCNRLGATSLTLRFSPGLGHICHVKGKDMKLELLEGRSVSSSKSTRSFHHPEWTSLGQKIDQCRMHIRAEEQRVFCDLRQQVIQNIVKLRHNAAVLDELDIACSFAALAAERNWVRPILNETFTHKIVGGRHPTVESGLEVEGRNFVTNDCFVGDTERTWLITGPNMAGKSTFLRQNALITILAQVGSYVPAEYAELGIVDQMFSRVGSADNLYRDQSTFMVEMLETAAILKNATSRSFVIMDEIGRGTTPTDGCAVAFACLHHLYYVNRCRTLFATHFHSLAGMAEAEDMDGVACYCTDIEEDEEGSFRYIHRLRKGVNKESHALKVARLAGLPEDTIAVAEMVLKQNWLASKKNLDIN